MVKKKGLFTILKRIFISEAHSEKKEKRSRRWTFWKLKFKKRLPSIKAPPENKTINKSHKEQKEKSLSDVGDVSQVSCSGQLDTIEKLQGSTSTQTPHLVAQYQMFLNRDEEILAAATRIQTAFRGHLARKALRALKGIVKLQAYIRGRAVRRQAMTTLKRLQSVVNIQSQVCCKRTHIPKDGHIDYEERNKYRMPVNTLKVDTNGQKRWDDSLLTKEEAKAVVMSKKEASLRRERIKEYAVTHRKSSESYQKRSKWLEDWVHTQQTKSKELEDLDLSLKPKPRYETLNRRTPRRQVSTSEEEEQKTGGVVTRPTYMVATESAKAKSRSLSTPRIRPRSFDTQSESYSPYKHKLSLTSSVMSEAPSKVRVGNKSKASAYQQRSPGLRGLNKGTLKSCNSTLLNDLSINSERSSLPSWNKQRSLR